MVQVASTKTLFHPSRADMRQRKPTSNGRAGFTLVELLVVIGIIAVLIGILMPSLSAVRRSAQITKCLATVRTIGSGATMHVESHRGYYPIAGHFILSGPGLGIRPGDLGDANKIKYTYITINEPWMKGITLAPWHAAIALQLNKKGVIDGSNNDDYADDEIGLRAYLKYFVCTSHNDVPGDIPNSMIYYGRGLIWMLQQSYVINEAVFGVNDAMGRLRGKATRIRRPAQTVMLADGLESGQRAFTYSGMNWLTFVNKVPTPPITLADAFLENGKAGDRKNFDMLRHRGKINILFFDGHAESRRIEAGDLQNVYLLAD